jgi:hypothetical protein
MSTHLLNLSCRDAASGRMPSVRRRRSSDPVLLTLLRRVTPTASPGTQPGTEVERQNINSIDYRPICADFTLIRLTIALSGVRESAIVCRISEQGTTSPPEILSHYNYVTELLYFHLTPSEEKRAILQLLVQRILQSTERYSGSVPYRGWKLTH